MVLEADLQETDVGLVPASSGWFVLNARRAVRVGAGDALPRRLAALLAA